MSGRRDEVFHVLKGIRWNLQKTHDLAERAIQEAANDRALAKHFREAATGGEWGKRFPEPPDQPTPLPVLAARIEMIGGGAGLHTLCLRLIDEREMLAKELENIRRDLDNAGIVPRTDNRGPGARGTDTKEGGGGKSSRSRVQR